MSKAVILCEHGERTSHIPACSHGDALRMHHDGDCAANPIRCEPLEVELGVIDWCSTHDSPWWVTWFEDNGECLDLGRNDEEWDDCERVQRLMMKDPFEWTDQVFVGWATPEPARNMIDRLGPCGAQHPTLPLRCDAPKGHGREHEFSPFWEDPQ